MSLLKDLEEALQIRIVLEPGEPSWTAMFLCMAAQRRRAEVRKVIEKHAPLRPMNAGIALYALQQARHGSNYESLIIPPKWKTRTFKRLEKLVDKLDVEADGDNELWEEYDFIRSLIRSG